MQQVISKCVSRHFLFAEGLSLSLSLSLSLFLYVCVCMCVCVCVRVCVCVCVCVCIYIYVSIYISLFSLRSENSRLALKEERAREEISLARGMRQHSERTHSIVREHIL